ncbi:MAG: phosphate acetyltransferase [Ignavibacteria bacterium]|nr:phosphate acetyltransferase [Ignavibacteria bacterium]
MSVMTKIWEKAKKNKKVIVLPEGSEARTINAAGIIKKEGLSEPLLVGKKDMILTSAEKLNVDLSDIRIIEPVESEYYENYISGFYKLRKAKGVTFESARETIKDEIYFATMMVKSGDADGMVSGAIHSTGDLLRPALQIIKTLPGISIVSSSFIMELPYKDFGEDGVLLFADCAINPNPSAEELASIAIATAGTAKSLCSMEPRIAMLSFSTKGSAKHELVDKVTEATKIVMEKAPEVLVDGELQLDAALIKKIGEMKAPGSSVAGKANVLIFPDLQAGNIGYKLVQRLAKAEAIGPVSQGFAKPVNDLSRGCSVTDIVNVVAITAVQSVL